jgi:hypothetical protein
VNTTVVHAACLIFAGFSPAVISGAFALEAERQLVTGRYGGFARRHLRLTAAG